MDDIDIAIEPGLGQLEDWLGQVGGARVLVLGEPDPALSQQLESLDADVRWTNKNLAKRVPKGLLLLRGYPGDGWYVVVSLQGSASGGSRRMSLSDLPYDDPLDVARDIILDLWPEASQHRGQSILIAGDAVRVLGSRALGRVRRVIRVEDSFEYEVDVAGQMLRYPESSLQKEHGLGAKSMRT